VPGESSVQRLGIVFLLAAVSLGCGKGSPYVPVTGTVKFSDGSVPKGYERAVTFQPVPGGPGTKGASSLIEDDGAFSLRTLRPGDGALPGNYAVTVHVVDAVMDGKSVVADKFTKASATPLKATVSADGENRFDFVVERP
jgi:hypothetical protein